MHLFRLEDVPALPSCRPSSVSNHPLVGRSAITEFANPCRINRIVASRREKTLILKVSVTNDACSDVTVPSSWHDFFVRPKICSMQLYALRRARIDSWVPTDRPPIPIPPNCLLAKWPGLA